jgi:hypothetical protein
MLFIHDRETEPLELDIGLEEGVRPDDNREFALPNGELKSALGRAGTVGSAGLASRQERNREPVAKEAL